MAKQELLATIRDRYRASSRKEKSRILDEFIPELTSGADRPPSQAWHQAAGTVLQRLVAAAGGKKGPTHLRRGGSPGTGPTPTTTATSPAPNAINATPAIDSRTPPDPSPHTRQSGPPGPYPTQTPRETSLRHCYAFK